jgi:hypothetical protein
VELDEEPEKGREEALGPGCFDCSSGPSSNRHSTSAISGRALDAQVWRAVRQKVVEQGQYRSHVEAKHSLGER